MEAGVAGAGWSVWPAETTELHSLLCCTCTGWRVARLEACAATALAALADTNYQKNIFSIKGISACYALFSNPYTSDIRMIFLPSCRGRSKGTLPMVVDTS